MDEVADEQPRQAPGPRQVVRIVLPVFIASMVIMVVGVLLVVVGHRTPGLIVVILGAVGGFAVRAWLMIRSQPPRH